jgi:ABC-2 type transport system permease protein
MAALAVAGLLIVALFSQASPLAIAAGALGLAIITVMGTALALLFSAANVFFRDFSNVVQTLTAFIHFGVPMLYPFTKVADRFGENFVGLYLANPIAEGVLLLQRCFWTTVTKDPAATAAEHMPDHLFTRGFIQLGACLLFLAFAQMVFMRLDNKFPERL